jgi:hypothetical protein
MDFKSEKRHQSQVSSVQVYFVPLTFFQPQCFELFSKPFLPFSANISKRDIRPIWAKQLISVDSCKIEQMQNDFDTLRQRHQEQEIELSKLRLAYQMCRNELTRKDAEIKRVQLMLDRYVFHSFYSVTNITLIGGI